MNGCPDATTERCEISRNPRKVCKRLIDAVHLRSWDHGLDDRHHALTHVAIQCVIATENLDAIPAQHLLDLKIRRAHFYKRLGIVASSDDATVVIAEHDNGRLLQIWTKNALTAGIKTIAIDQRKDRLMLFHDDACCSSPHPR